MPTDAAASALVFPGQGAQHAAMLAPFAGVDGFSACCDAVSARLGHDLRRLDALAPAGLAANRVSSLLTVLSGVLGLRAGTPPPVAVAGYSVGQFTALHAAGVIDERTLFDTVAERARLMDAALATAPPSGMLAVVGVPRAALDGVIAAVTEQGHLLALANDNAPGQATLGGTLQGLDAAEPLLAPHRPRLLRRLPVAAAWHGPLMAPVVAPLRAVLDAWTLAPARCPVIDNTSGGWLPLDDREATLDRLAQQVARPVLWQQGVRCLVQAGATELRECGWGDVLTRFGFFIDRSVRHVAMAPLPRERV